MQPDSKRQMADQPLIDADTADQIIGDRAIEAIAVLRKGDVASGIAISAILAGGVKGGVVDVRTAVQINGEPATVMSALRQATASIEQTYRNAGFGHLIAEIGPGASTAPTGKPLTPEVTLPSSPGGGNDTSAFLDLLADRLDVRGADDLANDCRREASKLRRR